MVFERYDIVVALFPFTDVAVSKPRPVLVLSEASFNLAHGHVIGCMITTGSESRWASDCVIRDGDSAGLTRPCVIRWKVFTLPLSVIARRIGTLSVVDRSCVTWAQAEVFGEASLPSSPLTKP